MSHCCLLAQGGILLDLLSYYSETLRGEVSAPVWFALADARTGWRDAKRIFEQDAGRFDVILPLMPAAKEIDLRDITALVVIPQQGGVSLRLDEVTLTNRPTTPGQPERQSGFWVWDYREAAARGSSLLDDCRSVRCSRLAVQMPALDEPEQVWLRYVALLQAAQEQGIEVFALDGYPEAIFDPHPLTEKVQRLVASMKGRFPAGIQLDIEPYLLDGFSNDPHGFGKYLDAHAQVKRALAGQARLSIVMPFWLTSLPLGNRAVAFAAIDVADEVAIMSYRTDLEELRELADDHLRYADLVGVPVWLALETRPLPLEEHVRLQRVTRQELATAYLDRAGRRLVFEPPAGGESRDWFRIVQRTAVRPERLTFAGRPRRQVQTMIRALDGTIINPSFAGVLIHDYTGFFALTEEKDDR